MKIATHGLEITPGKFKYNDTILLQLEKKFQPKKFTPFFFEFVQGAFDKCDAIAILASKILDILVLDMEKLEARFARASGDAEKELVKKALDILEKETPLCELQLTESQRETLKSYGLISVKPVATFASATEPQNTIVEKVMEKSGNIFFYTAGKDDVRAWLIKKGDTALTCAGKIHSDLEKSFISAKVINFNEFKNLHNFHEAEQKGLMKIVKADYVVQHGDIIEIIAGNAKK